MKLLVALLPCLLVFGGIAKAVTWEDYNKEDDPEKQIDLLTDIAWSKKFSDPDSFIILANRVILTSKAIDYPKGEGNGLAYQGVYYYLNDRYDSAIYFFDQALIIFEANNIKSGLAKIYNYKGLTFDALDEFSRAIDNYTKSLRTKEELGDDLGVANSLNNIATMQIDQDNYDKALENIEKAYTIYLHLNHLKGQAMALHNIGLIHDEQNNFESAIEYYLQSLHLEEKIGEDSASIALSYNNLGALYADEKRYDEAQYYYEKALAIYQSIDQPSGYCLIYNNLADAQRNLGNIEVAKQLAIKALNMSDSAGQPEKIVLAHRNLALAYQDLEQWENAAKHFERYAHLNDSLIRLSYDAEMEHLTNSLTMTRNYDSMQTAQFKVIQYGKQKVLKQVLLILGLLAILVVFGVHNNWVKLPGKSINILIILGVAALYEAAMLFHDEYFGSTDAMGLLLRYGGHIILFIVAVLFITYSKKISRSE